MTQDTRSIREFAAGESETLGQGGVIPTAGVWRAKPFRSNSAVSKMLALMLAHESPIDLINGQKIDVGKSLAWSNDKEYHHFFPQQHLARQGIKATASNVVGNIILLTSKSNIEILDRAPSDYLQAIIEDSGRDALVSRLATNLVPDSALDAALADDYFEFVRLRAEFLQSHVLKLTGPPAGPSPDPAAVDDTDEDSSD